MRLFDIYIRQLAVSPRHLKAGVTQHPLQAEDVAAISKK